MTMVFDSIQDTKTIGLEEISIAASLMLMAGLNTAIAEVEAEMAAQDELIDNMRGRQHSPVEVERVDVQKNFHVGSSPSMIVDENDNLPPLSDWPAISTMAYRANPSATDPSFDHGASYADSLFVEMVVKAGPDAGAPDRRQEVCNKRVWRTLEAVNRVLMTDPTLGGKVNGLDSPTAVVSEAFVRPEDELGNQTIWYWQAARVDYVVNKFYPFF